MGIHLFETHKKDIKKPLAAHTTGERGGHMADFAVLEQGESLARRLVARLGPAVDAGEKPALLVVAPGVCLTQELGPLECGTVLLPGGGTHLMELVHARNAVSYGPSGRDTITLSSREGERAWVSVQRELVRLDGTVLERQEVAVRVPTDMETMQMLALAGALLLMGVEPEELGT